MSGMKRALLCVAVVISSSCITTATFAATGFANSATGGAGGTTVTATTAANFKSYVESTSTYIVQVTGTIDLGSIGGGVSIRSNKTIRGIDTSPKIIGRLGFRDDATNVIIERLTITNHSYAEMDGISVKDRVTNVLITKCTIYDCNDGCLDITTESDYITVSWCKFYYSNPAPAENHRFVNLIGADDGDTGDRGKLHVTMHHNWWSSRCRERMPRVRFGQVHVYNNYYSCSGNNYCVRPGFEAQIFVENNYFNSVDEPIYTKEASSLVEAHNNIYYNCTHVYYVEGPDDVNMPPYSYIISEAADVPTIVQAYAGAETPDPPHWLDYPYGDFTKNNTVDMDDLGEFAGYWLTNTGEADYNGDGVVDFYEFSLLGENWLM